MRICIVTFFYKPAGGGIPRYVENLARSLSNTGNEVDIITASYDAKERTESENRITVYNLPSMNIFGKSEKECAEKSKDFLKFMKKYLSKNKADIILSQNLHAAISAINHCLFLNSLAIERNIPLTLTIHAFPENPYSQLKVSLAKSLFWDQIVAVSSSVAETFYDEGIDVSRIKVIHPGIDVDEFKPKPGRKWLRSRVEGISEKDIVILHASRTDSNKTVEEKGIKTLLKAFSFISSRTKNVKLLIASAPVPPPYEDSKKEAIKAIMSTARLYNIHDKVKIVTFRPENMPLVYNGCDIFVLASQLESFGLVYVEAMACGLPVIGTTVGGIPEIIINGRSGYLIPPNNSVELSKCLSMLLNDPKKRKSFGNFGRKLVLANFDMDKISLKRMGNYRSLIYHKKNSKRKSIIDEIAKE